MGPPTFSNMSRNASKSSQRSDGATGKPLRQPGSEQNASRREQVPRWLSHYDGNRWIALRLLRNLPLHIILYVTTIRDSCLSLCLCVWLRSGHGDPSGAG